MNKDPKQELRKLMGTIFENGYHASWMCGHEDKLWDAILHGPTNYGQTYIDETTISCLKKLSSAANGWWVYDECTEEVKFLTMRAWKKQFSPEQANYKIADVYDDIFDKYSTQKRSYFIYDHQCPICSCASYFFRASCNRSHIVLVDARKQKDHPVISLVKEKQVNMKTGIIIFSNKKIYHKGGTINFINEYDKCKKIFIPLLSLALWMSFLCHYLFPGLHREST